jgi:hypothetical protein
VWFALCGLVGDGGCQKRLSLQTAHAKRNDTPTNAAMAGLEAVPWGSQNPVPLETVEEVSNDHPKTNLAENEQHHRILLELPIHDASLATTHPIRWNTRGCIIIVAILSTIEQKN